MYPKLGVQIGDFVPPPDKGYTYLCTPPLNMQRRPWKDAFYLVYSFAFGGFDKPTCKVGLFLKRCNSFGQIPFLMPAVTYISPVSYTHLTLPTIYSV